MEINGKHTVYLPGRSVQVVTMRESRRQLEANYPGAIYLLTADNITRTTKPWKQCSANWLHFIKNNRCLETAAVITFQMKMQISYWKSLTTPYLWQNNTLPLLCSREWSITSMYCLSQVGTMLYNYNWKRRENFPQRACKVLQLNISRRWNTCNLNTVQNKSFYFVFSSYGLLNLSEEKKHEKKARKSPPTYRLWSDLCVCVYTNYMYTKQKTRLWSMKYSYMGSFIKYSK